MTRAYLVTKDNLCTIFQTSRAVKFLRPSTIHTLEREREREREKERERGRGEREREREREK